MRETEIAEAVREASTATLVTRDHESGRSSGYPWAAIRLLEAIVPSDAIAQFSVTDGAAELVGFPGEVPDGEVAEKLISLSSDHPMMLSYQGPARTAVRVPRRLSDLVTDRQLRRTRTYAELLRPVDRIRQATVVSTFGGYGNFTSWTLNRRRLDFTDHELALLAKVRPTLSLLDGYASRTSKLECGREHDRDRLGLTHRELEVLEAVKRGLTARAIGRLLGISTRTVSKHLEHSYRKLGCDNRVTALERLSGCTEPVSPH